MDPIELATQLIANPSITPDDANCQALIVEQLAKNNFNIQHLPYGEVSNLLATHGNGKPFIVFAGHTDIVPPGDNAAWSTPPFQPTIKNGYLYGRGAVDMKGGLAAMLVACINFVQKNPHHGGTIGILLTSDEEGNAEDGTKKVVEYLQKQQCLIDYCLIGEPTSDAKIADTIRIGRRGAMVATLKVVGIQGHVAYPNKIINPIHAALPVFTILQNKQWDQGNTYFPPTNLQITNLAATAPATNITPAELTCNIAVRFSPEITSQQIKIAINNLLQQYKLNFTINWKIHGEPFLTTPGFLVEAANKSIATVTGYTPKLSTAGGTSDGRFIAAICSQIVELGPINSLMHQVNECVCCEDLKVLSAIYQNIITRLLE